MNKNDIYEVKIEDVTEEGLGVGRADGMAVFVKDTAPGDLAKIKIVKVKKSYAYGRLEEIITPSSSRVEPVCSVARQCGGCTLQHISYESGAIHNHIQYEADRLHEQIFDEAEFLADEIDGVRSDVQQVGQDVQQVRQNQEDEQERNRIKAYIANCWQNKPIVTQGLLREFYRSKGKHIDKPGGLLPVPVRDNNALQSIIENMSLQELKEFEAMLRSNRATADID